MSSDELISFPLVSLPDLGSCTLPAPLGAACGASSQLCASQPASPSDAKRMERRLHGGKRSGLAAQDSSVMRPWPESSLTDSSLV